ncbi:hypothetical protein I587_00444 [Enterococcus mundtii ATCC 882]|nr:hypothetical protein UAC_02394 [Enterococcus mundtii ATCC 882]EOU11924.1 hypothetical protein I587_00444 [Enterococcus mundtii ATCC 882]
MTNNQFRLSIAMFFSMSCFVGGIISGESGLRIILFFMMTFPSLLGLYFSTKSELQQYKWLLISLNYFFATYIVIGQFIEWFIRKFIQMS